MINGTWEVDVPSDLANLPDWKVPIFIGIAAGKHGNISTTKKVVLLPSHTC
jgi:hypothetical protein